MDARRMAVQAKVAVREASSASWQGLVQCLPGSVNMKKGSILPAPEGDFGGGSASQNQVSTHACFKSSQHTHSWRTDMRSRLRESCRLHRWPTLAGEGNDATSGDGDSGNSAPSNPRCREELSPLEPITRSERRAQ